MWSWLRPSKGPHVKRQNDSHSHSWLWSTYSDHWHKPQTELDCGRESENFSHRTPSTYTCILYTIQEDDQFPPVVFLLWGSVAHFTCACPQFISQKGNRWDTEWLNDFHVPFDTTRNILTWTPPAKRRHKLLLKSFSCCINGEQTCLYLLSAPKNLFPTAHFSHRPLIKIHISNNFFIFVSRLHHLLLVQDSAFRHQREKCFLTKWL